MAIHSAYWTDLARDLEDPEFLRRYIVESIRIATVDTLVNALDEARVAAGLSKADLARAIHVEPATIRRFFSADKSNPTVGTLVELAAALGMRVALEPLSEDEREQVTTPLLNGRAADSGSLARHLEKIRSGPSTFCAASGE